ncbi:diguanylate cyclase [Micromonospora sp. WMMD1102]|uniref:diguanylate cyclase n=1 Tax=Micromonospora sp. WMMD1102 TaxID=3016105 RepID=UPI0032426CEC
MIGEVWCAQALDAAFVRRLAAASGTAVTLLREVPGPAATSASPPLPADPAPVPSSAAAAPGSAGSGPPGALSPDTGTVPPGTGTVSSGGGAVSPGTGSSGGAGTPGAGSSVGSGPVDGGASDAGPQGGESPSTESTGSRAAVLAAARRISGDKVVQANGGRYVRRVGPVHGQPLPLVLSVPRDPPVTRYGPLAVVVLLAGVFAVLAAGRLARSTTRPLAELARAADRVAEGDLATRVPVRSPDEVGRLADSFNRMTREAESYFRALVLSRHQLREQLSVLGDTLASSHDLHRILQLLLRAAMAATGARAGVVLLLDPRTGVLVGQCAEGLDRAGVGPGRPISTGGPGGPGGVARNGGTAENWGTAGTGTPQAAGTGDPGVGGNGDPGSAGAGRPAGTAPSAGSTRDRYPAGSRIDLVAEAGDLGAPAGDGAVRHTSALRVPLGKGLLGTVVATGEPRRGRLDRDGPRLYGREPRCRTYVAVPLPSSVPAGSASYPGPAGSASYPGSGTPSYPGSEPVTSALPLRRAADTGWPGASAGTGTSAGTGSSGRAVVGRIGAGSGTGPLPVGRRGAVGVLALYDRLGADEFDDVDLSTLGTFADHAAVAMENVRMHEEAQRLSLTDPLTGLWNYRYLKDSIRREIERASRFGRMLGVLALDLDRFKEVNDTYGHAAGDAVLAEFAQRIRGATREVDLAFRQGGEEFVVLLPETDARGAATVAERLGAAVRETPMAIRTRSGAAAPVRALVSVTVSIGVAVYPDHAVTGPQLLVAADEALYAAKAAGRDTYQMANAGRPTVVEIPVRTGAAPPDDGLPWAGGRPTRDRSGRPGAGGPVIADSGPDGALSGPQPPRQGRGR